MPQRRRCPHGFSGLARRARDLRLGLSTALLIALPPVGSGVAATPPHDAAAAAIAGAFADEEFCYVIPPRPMAGIFEPEAEFATALAHDHILARDLEPALRRAVDYPMVTLAPSYPFDAARMRVIEPNLRSTLLPVLRLYADYWAAARRAVIDGEATAFAATTLDPLRRACAAAVVLFVFSNQRGGIAAAGYFSLLTGRVLASTAPIE
jgi:hypothetical protein